MRWKLIPVFRDGKGRPRTFSYVLAMKLAEDEMPSYELFNEATMWCREQFGWGGESWHARGWDFEFVNQADAMAFKLRWG